MDSRVKSLQIRPKMLTRSVCSISSACFLRSHSGIYKVSRTVTKPGSRQCNALSLLNMDKYIARILSCTAMLSCSTFIEARWQKARRTLLAPGQLYGSPTGEYQDCYRMLRRVTLTETYRRAVSGQRVPASSY
jgi:hypothetical protein